MRVYFHELFDEMPLQVECTRGLIQVVRLLLRYAAHRNFIERHDRG